MQGDNVTRVLLAAILALLVAQWVGAGAGGGEASKKSAAAATSAQDRYQIRPVTLRRGPPLLIRLDTATGQAWSMGLMDKGQWLPIREDAAGVPAPDATRPGRFEVRAHTQSRGAPTLVRLDSQTGQAWRTGSVDRRPWVPIPNPEAAAEGEAVEGTAAPAKAEGAT